MKDEYIEISRSNVKEVAELLKEEKGRLLIYSPEMCSFPVGKLSGDADFMLFANARISKDSYVSASKSNHPKSREYCLRRRYPSSDQSWESAYGFFDVLKFENNYVFEIHGLHVVGCGLLGERGKAIYVPKNKNLEKPALEHVIGHFIDEISKQNGIERSINKNNLEVMVKYALDDLRTGKIWIHNTIAGQAADAVMGM